VEGRREAILSSEALLTWRVSVLLASPMVLVMSGLPARWLELELELESDM
jgi:hypothetical protein